MTSAIERAARSMCIQGAFDPDELTPNDVVRWRRYVPGASAAITAFLSEDEEMRLIVGNAYREGMREFLENMRGDSIGAINAAMQDAGARAAIAALHRPRHQTNDPVAKREAKRETEAEKHRVNQLLG